MSTDPVNVTVTGAGGQIAYALLFRIASGQLLGPDVPVRLRLLEIPAGRGAAEGTALELQDAAFPLLASVDVTEDARAAFDEALAGLLRGQREHDTMFSLLMLDLDHFKTFNDEFGHLAGDQVLRITGHLLRAALRPADMAARYGGEEFVLLLPGTDISGASEVATRLLDAFRGFAWPQRTVTVSIGMAQAVAGDAAEDLIRRADSSLYDAKRGGRDRAVAAIALPQVLRPGAFPRAVPGS